MIAHNDRHGIRTNHFRYMTEFLINRSGNIMRFGKSLRVYPQNRIN
jgi:hypothetical protein